jgi:epoxyqueuosine reductase
MEAIEPAFRPSGDNFSPDLSNLAAMTPVEFDARFLNSPIRRVKRDGFVRNVVVALGNSRRPEAIPALRRALRDASALVRGHAAWALGQIGSTAAKETLQEAQSREPDAGVQKEIALALDDLIKQRSER